MLSKEDKEDLDIIASSLPTYPPLRPGGDMTIKEMRPELTSEELDYIFSQYKGTMSKE